MIRLLSTLQGARRVWGGPILRLLDETGVAFVVGMTGCGTVAAIANEDGKSSTVDGSIDVLDLMAGGTLPAHNDLGPAGEAVLKALPVARQQMRGLDVVDVARFANADALHVSGGDLTTRRRFAVQAAARLIVAVERIDEELGT